MPSLVLQQFGVGARLDDLAMVHHEDSTRMAHCRQAMGDDGAALADGLYVLLDAGSHCQNRRVIVQACSEPVCNDGRLVARDPL